MTRKPHDAPTETALAEHYLFDLGQSVEKTAEILSMDEGLVRKVYDDHIVFIMPTRRSE